MLIQEFFLYLKCGLQWINNKVRWSNSFIQRTLSFFCLFHFTNLNLLHVCWNTQCLEFCFLLAQEQNLSSWRPSIEHKSFRWLLFVSSQNDYSGCQRLLIYLLFILLGFETMTLIKPDFHLWSDRNDKQNTQAHQVVAAKSANHDQNPTEYAYVQLLVLVYASLVETRLHGTTKIRFNLFYLFSLYGISEKEQKKKNYLASTFTAFLCLRWKRAQNKFINKLRYGLELYTTSRAKSTTKFLSCVFGWFWRTFSLCSDHPKFEPLSGDSLIIARFFYFFTNNSNILWLSWRNGILCVVCLADTVDDIVGAPWRHMRLRYVRGGKENCFSLRSRAFRHKWDAAKHAWCAGYLMFYWSSEETVPHELLYMGLRCTSLVLAI